MPKSVHPQEKIIGGKVRMHRVAKNMSMEAVGNAIGLAPQQIGRYERGENAIPARRLWQIKRVLGVPFGAFFEGLE